MNPRFTHAEHEYIRAHYLTETNAQIGAALGRTATSINWQMHKLKLSRGRKKWSPEEIEKLRAMAPGVSRAELAKHFNVPENILVAAMKNRKITCGLNTRFKPHGVSWNKGKKLPPEKITEAMKRNWFTKGHRPHNTGKNGDVSTRTSGKMKYKWIRISKNNWELLHRHNYKKFIGTIPDTHFVTFKDGNTLNCDPKNLKLEGIQEHMARNTIMRFDPQLRTAIHLLSKFKRKIKQYEKQD